MKSICVSLSLILMVIVMGFYVDFANPTDAQAYNHSVVNMVKDASELSTDCSGGASDGLVLDDNTAEISLGNWSNATQVNQYSVPGSKYQIKQVCVCLVSWGSTSATLDVVVYDTTGAGGSPGNEIARVGPFLVSDIPFEPTFPLAMSWYTFPVDIILDGGNYYIGYALEDSTELYVCADDSYDAISYRLYNNVTWIEETYFNVVYGIRAEGIILSGVGKASSQPREQIGMIMISTNQAQPVYDNPEGAIVRHKNGQELWLPQDYDLNGFDTHLVLAQKEVNGRIWVQIFVGDGSSLVWIPLDQVILLEGDMQ